jgi:hypothetical protein
LGGVEEVPVDAADGEQDACAVVVESLETGSDPFQFLDDGVQSFGWTV